MKKKPHQRQSTIKKLFSDFRGRLDTSGRQTNGVNYEVKKRKNGFTVVVHRERGANQTLNFDNKQDLDEYMKSR